MMNLRAKAGRALRMTVLTWRVYYMFPVRNPLENGMLEFHGDQQRHDQESEKDSSVLIPVSRPLFPGPITPSICFTTSSDASSNPFR